MIAIMTRAEGLGIISVNSGSTVGLAVKSRDGLSKQTIARRCCDEQRVFFAFLRVESAKSTDLCSLGAIVNDI